MMVQIKTKQKKLEMDRFSVSIERLVLTDGEVRGNTVQNSRGGGNSVEKSSILSIGSSQVDDRNRFDFSSIGVGRNNGGGGEEEDSNKKLHCLCLSVNVGISVYNRGEEFDKQTVLYCMNDFDRCSRNM